MWAGALLTLGMLGTVSDLTPAPAVRCDAKELVFGTERTRLTCTVQLEGAKTIHASANVGRLHPAGPAANGVQKFVYEAPQEKLPRMAMLAFWRDPADGKPPEPEVVRVRLLGRQTLTVSTRPGARVEIAIGRRRFGPVTAPADGQAQVPVEIPHDADKAKVTAALGGQVVESEIPLDVPASNPLHAILLPETLDHGQTGLLWVVHADRLPGRQLEFAHKGLVFKRLRFERQRGLFQLTVREDAPHDTYLEVRLADAPEARFRFDALLAD